MKKLAIALVLALVASLAFGTVALADVELYAKGDSTAEWSDEEAKFGDYSAKLSMRGGWWDSPNNNAEVQISIAGNPKISDITGWSYWTISPDKYTVPIELNLDTTGAGEIDKVLYATSAGTTPDGWFEVDQDTGHWWYGRGSPDNWAELQSWVDSHYADATLVRVDLGYGPLGSNQAIDAYVDGFTLNGFTYTFEPPPPKPKPKPKPDDNDQFNIPGQFDVILCSTAYYHSYKWEGGYRDGKILRDNLSQVCKSNGDYYRLDIPAGTEITSYGYGIWGLRMRVDGFGEITFNPKNIQFSEECSVSKGVDDEWVEVVSFTEIADGKAIQVEEFVPMGIYPGCYTITNSVIDAS